MAHPNLKISLAAFGVIMLAACSSGFGDKSKAMKVINEGLAKSPSCQQVPVDVYAPDVHIKSSIAIPALLASGEIEAGQVFEDHVWNGKIPHNGYRLTEKGRPLLAKPGDPNMRNSWPCIATGHWEVTSIEALDEGTDMTGKAVANVRARIRFIPRDWIAAQSNDPAWKQLFTNISKQESQQWMYQLLKSGDSFFYQGRGKSVD